jgi:beta-lactam-binding protein with PASTA domain
LKAVEILNHYIVKNVLILMVISILLFFGTLLTLRIYTKHGESVEVPDVRGLPLLEAAVVLRQHDMRWQLIDSVYVNSVRPGAIVNQHPDPDSKVKKGRNVFLIINALFPEMVRMPKAYDMSLRHAKSTLDQNGLIIGKYTYVPHINENYVLRQMYRGQEIRVGTEIVKGSEIELVIGRGLSSERTHIPNIIGRTFFEARDNLSHQFLNIGLIFYDNTITTGTDSIRAFIYRQRPPDNPNAVLQLGSSIDIWLTVDESKKPNNEVE